MATSSNTSTRFKKTILVTGGAGFIGSNLLLHLVRTCPEYFIINLDALTYAGHLENLEAIEKAPNYHFEKGDIADSQLIQKIFQTYPIDTVLHLAAESHVDRSIADPLAFVRTNVIGTVNLLNAARESWQSNYDGKLFYHISTDEVYGSLEPKAPAFTEEHRYEPHSPYSASKASGDHFVRAYHDTYGLPTIISNCSNNYGPFQFPEKLIPLVIRNILNQKPIPIYGDGKQVRDWLHVQDHVEAIELIMRQGKAGETYNIGGNNELQNIHLVKILIDAVDRNLGYPEGHSLPLITYVTDRPGHDVRYAINSSKISRELGWQPRITVKEGLQKTVAWYLTHQDWIEHVTKREIES